VDLHNDYCQPIFRIGLQMWKHICTSMSLK
jgi:hypothetical protein